MLYTLTTNPAIDMNIACNGLLANQVNRTFNAVYTPNGKGLNVSFVLQHFGIRSTILGFFGGFSGHYIVEQVKQRDIEILPIWLDDITRINVFVNDNKQEYKLVNEGAFVPKEKQQALLDQLEQLYDLDVLTISGSLAKGIEPDYYHSLLQCCQRKNSKVILDISSPNLAELLAYRPYLIKPNDEELTQIFGITLERQSDVIEALRYLHHLGTQNILLTLGEKGAYFFNGDQFYFVSAKPVELVSSACAGDASLAAFLSLWLAHPSQLIQALKRAAATGANVAESNGIGDLARVMQYQQYIEVKLID
ncbi:1-phosphofructokinase/6-phosphofructokinase 2 [Volucribacter psittacicida]|uniref:Phosphofructokinase n=1 Tax=Volucribacter psittacicida TaxID=203482 RepID=A0A4R1FTZ1_9PAST|nr:1-phosphofructokinase [Volucribacter psittacicida]TCJ98776.1 1-phosphofructokinase/6-phosphofructokinase 2 [Volucribacter psittacicida]